MNREKEIHEAAQQEGKILQEHGVTGGEDISYQDHPQYNDTSNLHYGDFLSTNLKESFGKIEDMPGEVKDIALQEGKNLRDLGASYTNDFNESSYGEESKNQQEEPAMQSNSIDNGLRNDQFYEHMAESPESSLEENFHKLEEYSHIEGIPLTRDEFIDQRTDDISLESEPTLSTPPAIDGIE